jgi:hypothetical protein
MELKLRTLPQIVCQDSSKRSQTTKVNKWLEQVGMKIYCTFPQDWMTHTLTLLSSLSLWAEKTRLFLKMNLYAPPALRK